jgi:hypothetical protein
VLFGDRAQVAGDAPSISHVCHGIEDDLYFAVHDELSSRKDPKGWAVSAIMSDLPEKPS